MVTRDEAAQVVTALDWRDEVTVLAADRIRVAAVDRLGGITPAMLDWWFSRMDETTYFRFHPVDHKAFAWVRGKQPGQHVGAVHLTHHCYGGQPPLLPTEIGFIPPGELLDVGAFAANGVGAAVCAVVHRLTEAGQPEPAEAGRFVHVAMDRGYGTELRSCWWLNIGPDTDLDVVTNRRLRHVHEEFAYLAGFLPALYASEHAGQQVPLMTLRFAPNLSLLWAGLPLADRFERAAAAGFGAVELWWPGDDDAQALPGLTERWGLHLALLNFDAGDMPGGDRGLAADQAARAGCQVLIKESG